MNEQNFIVANYTTGNTKDNIILVGTLNTSFKLRTEELWTYFLKLFKVTDVKTKFPSTARIKLVTKNLFEICNKELS